MCSFLNKTPKQLGKLRETDPTGINFLERSYIWRKQQEYEQYKKQEKEAKAHKAKPIRRR